MGRYTGILGLLTMLGLAYAFSTNRRAIRLKTVAWGLGPADRLCDFCAACRHWATRPVQAAGDASERMLSYSFVWARSLFSARSASRRRTSDLFSLFRYCRRSSSSARCSPILYHSASCRWSSALGAWVMTRVMGASGAESLNRCRQHFHGANRSAGDDPAVSARS